MKTSKQHSVDNPLLHAEKPESAAAFVTLQAGCYIAAYHDLALFAYHAQKKPASVGAIVDPDVISRSPVDVILAVSRRENRVYDIYRKRSPSAACGVIFERTG
jgi:hypothetical protein